MKLLFIPLLLFNALYAQDLIYLKKQTTPVNAKVIEINHIEIKYKLPSDSFPIMSFLRIEVQKIELSNGVVLEIEKDEDLDENKWVGAVKFGLFSPAFDHINFSYEGYTDKNKSWEITAGWIGNGRQINENEKPRGSYLKLGYKWIASKKINPIVQPKKLLGGFYVKPELSVGQYTIYYDDKYVGVYHPGSTYYNGYYTYSYVPVDAKKITFATAMINFGYQAVSVGGLTIDVNAGFGYYAYSEGEVEDFNYAFIPLWEGEIPLAINFGVKVGYTFCKEKRF